MGVVVGIHAYGGYVPTGRLSRQVVVDANVWFNSALAGLGRGERSIANWDEDPVTMAVEAARDVTGSALRQSVQGVYLASTSLPFADRQNAGIVAEALQLGGHVRTLDVAGSQRAGTSALLTACQVAMGGGGPILVVAGERRRTRAAGPLELTTGDGAAALLVSEGEGGARLLGHATETADFVSHYRGQGEAFDYVWEERWIRDEGYLKLVPAAVERALNQAGVEPRMLTRVCIPTAMRRVSTMLASKIGVPEASVSDNLQAGCGEVGAAHPLVMLVHALEQSRPGDTILVIGFGQGCDAIVVRVCSAVADIRPRLGIGGHLALRREETNYQRYLAINDLVTIDRGLRAEMDKQTGLTTLYRNKEMLLGMVGGRCRMCGTPQYPKTHMCVAPDCQAMDTQDDYPFAELPAYLKTYTADRLTYSPDPPAYYGMVEFKGGGQVMLDFTDVGPGTALRVGQPMRMMFRVKDYDSQRGFRRYFWKATPCEPIGLVKEDA